MNRSRLLKNAFVFFLFFGLLWVIHQVNQKRQQQILAHVWINPRVVPDSAFSFPAEKTFHEDAFFEALMVRILRHRDSQLVVYLKAEDSAFVAKKILQNPRFVLH